MKIAFVMVALGLTLAASSCSHGANKADPSNAPAAKPMPHALSSEDVLQKYSLLQLNSAATVLRVISDEAKKPSEDKGTEIIGCPLSGAAASKMTMPVKALIDGLMHTETENYVADPKNYATEKGFEICAPSCACGVLSDVVTSADEKSLPQAMLKLHARAKSHLEVKATHQSRLDSLACARKVSWFCGSDLKAYLEKEAHEN